MGHVAFTGAFVGLGLGALGVVGFVAAAVCSSWPLARPRRDDCSRRINVRDDARVCVVGLNLPLPDSWDLPGRRVGWVIIALSTRGRRNHGHQGHCHQPLAHKRR